MNFSTLYPCVKYPTEFSKTSKLTDAKKTRYALTIFPQAKRNIQNEKNGIREFLEKTVRAHDKLKLSLDDFQELLILSTSSRLNEVLRAFIENKLSIQRFNK